jgi:SH3-like domain-containing protein
MESWKSFGIFLSGLAATITAVTVIISHLNESPYSIAADNLSTQQIAIVKDPDGWVNVREAPSISSPINFKLANNHKVYIIDKLNNWYKIKTIDDQAGYIYYDRLNILYYEHYIKK